MEAAVIFRTVFFLLPMLRLSLVVEAVEDDEFTFRFTEAKGQTQESKASFPQTHVSREGPSSSSSLPLELATQDPFGVKESDHPPPVDQCQLNLVEKLQSHCGTLTEEQLGKLAVGLFNCQAELEGRRVFPCSDDMPLRDCTITMDTATWNAYLLVSNRARADCYRVQQEIWRRHTEATINHLSNSAEFLISTQKELGEIGQDTLNMMHEGHGKLAEAQQRLSGQLSMAHSVLDSKLNQSLAYNEHIMQQQNASIATQDAILEKSIEVKQALNATTQLLDHVKEEIKEQQEYYLTGMQRIYAGLDQLLAIESAILEHFFDFHSFLFYVGAIILATLFTSPRRTARARVWLYFGLLVTALLEKALSLYIPWAFKDDLPILILSVRKAYVVFAAVAYIQAFLRYKDQLVLQAEALDRIQSQNERVLQILQRFEAIFDSRQPQGLDTSTLPHLLQTQPHGQGTAPRLTSTSFLPSTSNFSIAEIEDEDFKVSEDELESSSDGSSTSEEEDEGEDAGQEEANGKKNEFSGHCSRSEKPRESLSPLDLNQTPLIDSQGLRVGPYLLRKRSTKTFENPILKQETPEEFHKHIRRNWADSLLHRREEALLMSDEEEENSNDAMSQNEE